MTAALAIEESVLPGFWLQPKRRDTVLVVEDDRLVREATRELLRQPGYEAIEAESVLAANDSFMQRNGFFLSFRRRSRENNGFCF